MSVLELVTQLLTILNVSRLPPKLEVELHNKSGYRYGSVKRVSLHEDRIIIVCDEPSYSSVPRSI